MMINQLQICNWLVNHPNILQMAIQMLNMKDGDGLSSAPSAPEHTSSNVSVKITDRHKCSILVKTPTLHNIATVLICSALLLLC